MVAAVNERLLNAVISSREITIGALRLRCMQCHLGPGMYDNSGSPGTHQHDETQIELPLSARFDFTVNDSRIALKPAQALVIPPHTPHNWETRGGFMLGIQISAKDPSGAEVALPFARGRAPLVVANRAVTSHLRQLVDLAVSKRSSAFTPGLCSSLLMVLIGEVLDAVCGIPKPPETKTAGSTRAQLIYERATGFIKTNLGHSLNARALALQAGVSFRHLTRIFIQHDGEPPHSYVLRLRLEAARAILDKEPATPIKVLAYDCGFSSASHFTSAFKKSQGVSPSVYAARTVVR
ncbi:MAG: AraC family transcriptional regulator [Verrucomicrobia bacterium]|nr:AraC family transcriptional regulator [Verrucomicrobiota bacterium]